MKYLVKNVLLGNRYFNCVQCIRFSSRIGLQKKLIDGKNLASKYLGTLKDEISKWVKDGNKPPQLSVVLIEGNASNEIYVNMKCRAAEFIGIRTEVHRISKMTTQSNLLRLIQDINSNSLVDGIVVQLPLSPHMDLKEVCNRICPSKDVDGFTSDSLGRLCHNEPTFVPCTALSVHRIVSSLGVKMKGKQAVVCGRSKHVGLPIALILHSSTKLGEVEGLNMSTTICHRHTPADELINLTKTADLLVTAVGQPNLIKGNMIKPGAIVIDVGFSEVQINGKRRIVGDVDMPEVLPVASLLSPVPGGVGPVTVAMLMNNTFIAAKIKKPSQKLE